jgi:hypothetical protein
MRLSEKTIELNFCSQANAKTSSNIIWFGLTQKQEAKLGFDVFTELNGHCRLLVFQFKASNMVMQNSSRRFQAPHDQMVNLKNLINHAQKSAFYVFPLIGDTAELKRDSDLIKQSLLLDVASIPDLPPPTKNNGDLRKNGIHYIDVKDKEAEIHSESFRVGLIPAETLFESFDQNYLGSDGLSWLFENFEQFWELCQYLPRTSTGAIVC